ncbi:MAG: ornithine carbamoyltransferase [Candidatus Azotimanducaceae bacterium]|jgi:ornithine carbamoyltransferase
MKHVANLKDFSKEEITLILEKAKEIKRNPAEFYNSLHRKTLAMLFQKTSTRTRVSFEAAMTELGGHAIYIDWSSSNFVLSGIEHETEYLSRNVACIMARLFHHSDLQKIISASKVPVINGCDDLYHPCQALTDVLTMTEHFEGNLSEAHLVYVGVQNNVSNSLVTICNKLDIQLTLATPELDDNGECQDAEIQNILKNSSKIRHTCDPKDAVQDADFVYTDTWIDMQYFNNPEHADENEKKLKKMAPYQINKSLLSGLKCKVMHDMPIHDGFEISAEMTQDERAIIYPQSENRMHAQKGLLWYLLQDG